MAVGQIAKVKGATTVRIGRGPSCYARHVYGVRDGPNLLNGTKPPGSGGRFSARPEPGFAPRRSYPDIQDLIVIATSRHVPYRFL